MLYSLYKLYKLANIQPFLQEFSEGSKTEIWCFHDRQREDSEM